MRKKISSKKAKKSVKVSPCSCPCSCESSEEIKMPLLVWFLSVLLSPVLLLMVPVFFGGGVLDYSQLEGTVWPSVVMTLPSIILAFVISLALNKEYFDDQKTPMGVARMSLIIATVINIFVLMSLCVVPELIAFS